MEKIVGIDLAGLPKNETGLCALKEKETKVKTVKEDKEIVKEIERHQPKIIGIDGPLSKPEKGQKRRCDEKLEQYGSLPPLMSKGMKKLTERAITLSKKLRKKGYKTIEVKPSVTAKILGIKREEGKESRIQKEMISLGLKGTIGKRMLTIDELDSILAALTGKLHLEGKTKKIGREGKEIVIPKVEE